MKYVLDRNYFILLIKSKSPFFILFFLFCSIGTASIPFHKTFPFFPFILSVIAGFLHLLFNGYERKINWNYFIASISLFAIFIYAYAISSNKSIALSDLSGKMAIGVFPILFYFSKSFTKQHAFFLIGIFVLSCLLFATIALLIALYKLVVFFDNDFYYKSLLEFTSMHPAYIGMFCSFSIACLSHFLVSNFSELLRQSKILILMSILFLLLFVLLLAAKTAIISSILLIHIFFIVWGRKYRNLKFILSSILVLNILGICIIFLLPTTRERIAVIQTFGSKTENNSVNSRYQIWNSLFENRQEFWLVGVGNGNDIESLVSFYTISGFEKGITERYNAHNEFLQIWLTTGIFGIVAFLFLFYLYLRNALENKQFLYTAFLVIFLLNCFTESMFETQSGILFFSLFQSVFLSAQKFSIEK